MARTLQAKSIIRDCAHLQPIRIQAQNDLNFFLQKLQLLL